MIMEMVFRNILYISREMVCILVALVYLASFFLKKSEEEAVAHLHEEISFRIEQ